MRKIFGALFFPVSITLATFIVARTENIDQALTYSIVSILVSLLSVAFIEKIFPINAAWSGIRKDSFADLLSIVTVAGGVETVLKWLYPLLIAVIYNYFPSIKLFNIHEFFNNLWTETIVVVLLIEFVRYWYHRISHENFYYWKIHSSHHCPTRMYFGNSYRLNPIYHIIVSLLSFFPFILLGVDVKVFILYNTMLGITANFQHANIVLNHGFMSKVFSTSEVHKWHHSVDLKEGMNNYGALLSIYDVIFGSFYNPKDRVPTELGITNEPWYPKDNYFKQVIVPFYWKKWKRNYRKSLKKL